MQGALEPWPEGPPSPPPADGAPEESEREGEKEKEQGGGRGGGVAKGCMSNFYIPKEVIQKHEWKIDPSPPFHRKKIQLNNHPHLAIIHADPPPIDLQCLSVCGQIPPPATS